MKTITLVCALLLGAISAVNAQWNTLGGNTITLPTEYLGCDGLSTQPLRFSTMANFRHEWRTGNVMRMRLSESLIGAAIGTYPGLDLSGHLGIGTSEMEMYLDPFPCCILTSEAISSQVSGRGTRLVSPAQWIVIWVMSGYEERVLARRA